MNDVYDLLKELKSLGARIYAVDNKIKLDIKQGALTKEISEKIKHHREDILTLIDETTDKFDFGQIEKVAEQASYPMSDAQRRLWVLSQVEESLVAYHIPGNIYLDSTMDIGCFKRALESVMERHEILRTVFKADETGEIRQWILDKEDPRFKINYTDYRQGQNKQQLIQSHLREDAAKPFDMEKGPLFRAGLLQVEDEDYVFYFNMHHIISDGWSMSVLFGNLRLYYDAYKENKPPELMPLRIQYKDYSAWQLAKLDGDAFKAHRAYWVDSLQGELPILDLPVNKPRPRVKTFNGQSINTFYIGSRTTGKLKKYAEENGGSFFMGLFAAWNVLMHRYTSQTDIIIGTPLTGREHVDMKDQIGFYVNTLAIRNEVRPEENFNAFFSRVKQTMINAYSHQLYPFNRLIEELDFQRDTGRSAVFDIMLVFNDRDKEEGAELKKEELNQIADVENSTSKFDLEIGFKELNDYLSVWGVYNPDVYEGPMVEGLLNHYKQLLHALLENPEKNISEIDYLSEKEKQQLLVTFNNTEVSYPEDKTIVELFEEQAAKTPGNIALVFEDKQLTYRELDEQSNQLAHCLRENYNITAGDLVGIQLDRSERVMLSILGILKAGGAYVPVDPEYPAARKQHIIEDTSLKLLITQADFVLDMDYYEGAVFAIDVEFDPSAHSPAPLKVATTPADLAYVMYTSGSTGKPKGVMVEQKSVVRLVKNTTIYTFSPSDKLLCTGAISFDATTFEYWGPLLNGGQLVMCAQRTLLDIRLLHEQIKSSGINIMWFTAGWLNQLVDADINLFNGLKTVIAGGDKLSPAHIRKLRSAYPELEIINGYGPTENTTFSITHNILEVTGDIPLGKPVSNSSAYILDENNFPQPPGVAGEICLGGDGLARGYLNHEELTKEKFIANPFKASERLYKTGDLGRWTKDGIIEFIGRKDNQVKIRGYRIELGEIEQALLKNEEIEEAVVLAKENQNGEKELVAYITSKQEQNISELRAYLKELLPEYMLPAYYVQLEAMPLNANGKTDRKTLPDPQGLGLSSGTAYVAPGNETEEKLVKIWEELLQRGHIGIKDDFFALGGHSLKAIRLSNEYQKELSVKISLKDLFANTSIESHAALIENSKRSEFIRIEKTGAQASYAISDAQRRLWVLSQFEGGSVAYNIPNTVYLSGSYNIENFAKAIDATIERHEILRTIFKTDETGEIKQWIINSKDLGFKIDYKDFRNEKNKEEQVSAYTAADAYKIFDLEKGPLLRAALLQVADEEYVFYYNMHHIISDGWSMEVVSKDVLSYYEAYKNNQQPQLKELRIQYKDYSAWQLLQLKEESFKAHRHYWLNNLSGELPVLDLPGAKQRPRVKTNKGQVLGTFIDAATSDRLKKYTNENGGSLFMGLLAAWNVLMYRYTSQTDIITGTPIAGREHADLEDQVGFYLNTLALRNEINPAENFDELFSAIKQNTLQAYTHQVYPFDRLVEELKLQRDTSRSAVFDVMITLQNNGEKEQQVEVSAEGLNRIENLGYRTSKFDIDVSFREAGDYLSFQITYNPDVYERETAEGLLHHYRQLLSALLENTEKNISEIDYLSETEKHELLLTLNNTAAAYPKDKTVVDLFEELAAKTPGNIALVFEDKQLTYRELDEQSNQLADYLQKNYAIQPDDLIGIKQERSAWMIISLLGVLKSGGAYVPIDPGYPQERITYIEKDTRYKVCIDENELTKFRKSQNTWSKNKIRSSAQPVNLAYVIYTSGSTGRPKGVMIAHASLAACMVNIESAFGLAKVKKMAGSTNLTFDISALEIWGALCYGKELVLLSDQELNDPYKFLEKIETLGVEGLQLTPSRLSQLYAVTPRLPGCISLVLIGGEALSRSLYNSLQKQPFESINVYGPTETTIWSTSLNISSSKSLGIGRPLLNEQVYILNEKEQLQPKGITGEICIGGDGLARGYLNQEALTKEKFIANPFKASERLYKTGDLGRWTKDGIIEFIGRKDNQVKIRGYRIELGEIEQALLKNEEIEEAVVLAKENQNGEKELVAYITSKQEQNISELRAYLKELLPEYMLPAYYVQLEAMPLNANGKTDRKALPDPQGLGLSSGTAYVAPGNETEEKLVKIWEELLQRGHIGIKDDFFALGGHSLKAIRLSNEYQKELSVKISLKDLFANTSIESHAALIQASKRSEFIRIEKTGAQASYAISDAQRRLWVLSQFEGGSVAYNIPNTVYLSGSYNIENFAKAIDATIERHEILRTVFKADETNEIRQWIINSKDLGFKIDYKDFRNEKNKNGKVSAYTAADAYHAFDLEKGPLLRAALLQVADEEYVFYYNMHHIISDGWSMEVVSKDVLSYYEAYKNNQQPQLKELRIQYKDYSAWQLLQLKEESFKAHRHYWLNNLSGELPVLDLPGAKQRPRVKTNNGQVLGTFIDEATSDKLKKYTNENGGSLFMGLLAAWNVLMYRYTSQTDIITGTPIAGREHADLEDQVGFYVNTLALRNEINPEESFDAFYQALKENTLKSYDHQMYPFDRLVEELNLQRDTGRSAVFDVLLNLQNNGEKEQGITIRDEELSPVADLGSAMSKFDMELSFKEIGDYLSFNMTYNPDVYERDTVEALLNHYKQLLKALLESPGTKVSQIDYLSVEEKHELLFTFNDTAVDYPKHKTITALFEEQAAKTPDRIAVVFEEKELTYRELNEQANQLAHYLQKHYAIQPDDLVGIRQERSAWMMISILAVLKSGGAYVPIDPGSPQDRTKNIIADSGCKVLLDEAELNKFQKAQAGFKINNTVSNCRSNNLVYVIYTSGSTGQPKGVLVEHSGVVNRLLWMRRDLKLDEHDVFLQKTPVTFDVSVWELFLPLITGSKLVVPRPEGHKDPVYLEQIMNDLKVSIIHFVPSMLSGMLDNIKWNELKHLRHVVCSGEALPKKLENLFKERSSLTQLHNYYGPTEASVDVTAINLTQFPTKRDEVSIGKPVDNTSIYIVNDMNALQPLGVLGEILLGGVQIARGYLNKEALNKEKFIASPFKAGERLYKTGDLGRWLPDGTIEYIGRKDNQVKIRGYRIEPGEIEHALLKNAVIQEAVVLARENQNKEKELVAYITAKAEQNISDLRSYLKDILPDYMLPAYYVQLPSMPLNANGKTNRKALPDPEGLGIASGIAYVAPRSETEAKLVKIWEELLQREHIGVQDNFFAMGGHSIKIIQAIKAYKLVFGRQVPLNFFFSNPNIHNHAEYIGSLLNESIPAGEELVKLNAFSGSNKTMIMIPPVQGEAIYFMGFAKFIEDRYNCYGISYSINHGFKTLTELSAYYAGLIDKHAFDQTTTLHIMGFSMGAPVAFEIVKILEGLNYNCELLLVDRMPNGELFLKEKRKAGVEQHQKWLDQQVAIASKISPGESVALLRERLVNNMELLDQYTTTGTVKADILCLEASAFNMALWKKHTHGDFILEKIKATHDDIFNKEHYAKLVAFIQKIKFKKSNNVEDIEV